jgi:hypothetical protein
LDFSLNFDSKNNNNKKATLAITKNSSIIWWQQKSYVCGKSIFARIGQQQCKLYQKSSFFNKSKKQLQQHRQIRQ